MCKLQKQEGSGAVKAILGDVVVLPMLNDPLIKYKYWCQSIFYILNIWGKETTQQKSLSITIKEPDFSLAMHLKILGDLHPKHLQGQERVEPL